MRRDRFHFSVCLILVIELYNKLFQNQGKLIMLDKMSISIQNISSLENWIYIVKNKDI